MGGAANKRMHPIRAPRGGNWLVAISKAWASDRVFPAPRERVVPTVTQRFCTFFSDVVVVVCSVVRYLLNILRRG
jgi:hypothetical protein